MERIKILVVDDSLTIRAMIETLLDQDDDLIVVGVARNAEEAFAFIAEHDPDVVTLDVAMPGWTGWNFFARSWPTNHARLSCCPA